MINVYEKLSRGSTNRRRLNVEKFLSLTIPVPASLDDQTEIAERLSQIEASMRDSLDCLGGIEESLPEILRAAIHDAISSVTESL